MQRIEPTPATRWLTKLAMSASMVAGVLLLCLVAGTTAACVQGLVMEQFSSRGYSIAVPAGGKLDQTSGAFTVPKADEQAGIYGPESTSFAVKKGSRREPSVTRIVATQTFAPAAVEGFSAPGFPGWEGPAGMLRARMASLTSDSADKSIKVTTPLVCYSSDGSATGILKKTNTGVDYCYFMEGECTMPDGSKGRYVENVCKPAKDLRSTLEIKNIVTESGSDVSVL